MNPNKRTGFRVVGKGAIYLLLVLVCAFVIIEGVSSGALFVVRILSTRRLAETLHTRYDELLGWVNIPNLYVKNMYGPGVFFRTNSQSFRNDKDFSVHVPNGKLRVICSGDSFTLGYGVDNDHTWCQFLASCDERLETVNMGQGGYGIDQMYLWYMRDGIQLDHNIHILAFITEDVVRMTDNSLFGYGKPVLQLKDGTITVENVPVPRRAYYVPWLVGTLAAIKELNSIKLVSVLSYPKSSRKNLEDDSLAAKRALEIALRLFELLRQQNEERNSTFVVVYLPTKMDYDPNTLSRLREFLSAQLSNRGVKFIDLVSEFRKLPRNEVDGLFISGEDLAYLNAAGHYSVKGNQYIARVIYSKLLSIPEIAENLSKTSRHQT